MRVRHHSEGRACGFRRSDAGELLVEDGNFEGGYCRTTTGAGRQAKESNEWETLPYIHVLPMNKEEQTCLYAVGFYPGSSA